MDQNNSLELSGYSFNNISHKNCPTKANAIVEICDNSKQCKHNSQKHMTIHARLRDHTDRLRDHTDRLRDHLGQVQGWESVDWRVMPNSWYLWYIIEKFISFFINGLNKIAAGSPRPRALAEFFYWPWAMSHESWGMSQAPWAMSHEPLTIKKNN